MTDVDRRSFLKTLATAAGAVVLMPSVTACNKTQVGDVAADPMAIPRTKPQRWDPIVYNRLRGNAGAIPDSYLDDINGPEGVDSHLGKHLPWTPELPQELVPSGYVAIMWGDPAKGHTEHPNAVPNEGNNYEGHWYNWIRLRKATDEEAIELQSEYTSWPGTDPADSGRYAVHGDGDITDRDGKDTVYLAAIPADCVPGDVLRIHAHCLTHGEYVDFITL